MFSSDPLRRGRPGCPRRLRRRNSAAPLKSVGCQAARRQGVAGDAEHGAFHGRGHGAGIDDVLPHVGPVVDAAQDDVRRVDLQDLLHGHQHAVGGRAGDGVAALARARGCAAGEVRVRLWLEALCWSLGRHHRDPETGHGPDGVLQDAAARGRRCRRRWRSGRAWCSCAGPILKAAGISPGKTST